MPSCVPTIRGLQAMRIMLRGEERVGVVMRHEDGSVTRCGTDYGRVFVRVWCLDRGESGMWRETAVLPERILGPVEQSVDLEAARAAAEADDRW